MRHALLSLLRLVSSSLVLSLSFESHFLLRSTFSNFSYRAPIHVVHLFLRRIESIRRWDLIGYLRYVLSEAVGKDSMASLARLDCRHEILLLCGNHLSFGVVYLGVRWCLSAYSVSLSFFFDLHAS